LGAAFVIAAAMDNVARIHREYIHRAPYGAAKVSGFTVSITA